MKSFLLLCMNFLNPLFQQSVAHPLELTAIQGAESCDIGDLLSNITSSPNVQPDCYGQLDPVFFGESERAAYFDYAHCYKEGLHFWSQFKSKYTSKQLSQGINYWYTGDNRKPESAVDPSLRLPVFWQSNRCAFVLMSTKELDDFCRTERIKWREKWGPKSLPFTSQEVFHQKATEVFLGDGFFGAMDCVKISGSAGHTCELRF